MNANFEQDRIDQEYLNKEEIYESQRSREFYVRKEEIENDLKKEEGRFQDKLNVYLKELKSKLLGSSGINDEKV